MHPCDFGIAVLQPAKCLVACRTGGLASATADFVADKLKILFGLHHVPATTSCRIAPCIASSLQFLPFPHLLLMRCCCHGPQTIKLWWGYLRIQASGTQLQTQMISDSDGSIMDSLTLRKPQNWGSSYLANRQTVVAVEQQQEVLIHV